MTGKGVEEQVPDWMLERHVLGELPSEQGDAVRDALERREDLRERLRAIRQSSEEILARHPPAEMAAAIRARAAAQAAPGRPRATAPFGRVALVLAIGVAAALGGTVLAIRGPAQGDGNGTRSKGLRPQLLLYRRAGGEVEQLAPGAIARVHEVVQLAYQAAGRRHGVVVSIDGAGVITRHLPASGTRAAALAAGGAIPLPAAYELDDAPAFERFFLVTADEPFDVETVVAAVRRHAQLGHGDAEPLDLPGALDQSSFVLRKEPTR